MVGKEAKKTRGKEKSIAQKKENVDVKEVEFSLYAPEAREVFLAGEFNQWNARSLAMKKDDEGI